jgi:TIR domain
VPGGAPIGKLDQLVDVHVAGTGGTAMGLRSRSTDAASTPDVFLSYSSADRARAEELARALQAEGISVWWDRHIPPGRTYQDVISSALRDSSVVVVLWTHEAVGSSWVRDEAQEGLDRGRLVPVLLDDVAPPLGFRQVESAHLESWTTGQPDSEFDDLVRAIREATRAAPPASQPVARKATPSVAKPTTSGRAWWQQTPIVLGAFVTIAIIAITIAVSIVAISSRREGAAGTVREFLSLVGDADDAASAQQAWDLLEPQWRVSDAPGAPGSFDEFIDEVDDVDGIADVKVDSCVERAQVTLCEATYVVRSDGRTTQHTTIFQLVETSDGFLINGRSDFLAPAVP